MIEQFKGFLIDEEKSGNTISGYLLHVQGYLQWFRETKDIEFTQLHRENVKDYISYLKTIKQSKPKTINAKISCLIKFNEFLILTGVQQTQVISKKDNIKIQQQYASLSKIELKDVEKFRQLVLDNEKSKRNHAIITLLSYGGLRISEALSIKNNDFNLVSREILVSEGKGKKTRTVFMNDKIVAALKEWLKERQHNDSEYLFTSNRGQQLNRTVINKLFNKYSKQVGKEITPHDLRHFYCSHALASGLSVHEVANQAGHSNIHTTLLYTNPSKDAILEKINKL